MGIRELISFDNEQKLGSFHFSDTGIHFWPLVRFNVLMNIYNRMTGCENPHAASDRVRAMQAAAYLWNTIRRMPTPVAGLRILFLSSGVVNTRVGEGFENRLYDTYLNLLPEVSHIIEDSVRFGYRRPRCVRSVRYFDLIDWRARVRAKLFGKVADRDRSRIEEFINFFREKFSGKANLDDETYIRNLLLLFARRSRHYAGEYTAFLKKLRPRLVIREDASYGATWAILMKCAHNLGIITAEIEHGLISHNHHAYNFGDSLPDYYRDYLPRYLLTFGKYWSEQLNAPVHRVEIGYPFLNRKAKTNGPSAKRILIVSDGTLPQLFKEIVFSLRRSLPGDWLLIFKLHPGETPLLEQRYGDLRGLPLVQVETRASIYDLLSHCCAVVGCASTVLYEALAFGRPVFVLDNEMSRLHVHGDAFLRFEEPGKLAAALAESSLAALERSQISQYWCPDPEARYLEFIRSLNIL